MYPVAFTQIRKRAAVRWSGSVRRQRLQHPFNLGSSFIFVYELTIAFRILWVVSSQAAGSVDHDPLEILFDLGDGNLTTKVLVRNNLDNWQ